MNLNDLQIALIDNSKAGVRAVIDEIDRRTENEMFRRAGEHFGFQTGEWSGRRVAYQGDLSRVFGYADPSGLAKLAERYELEAINLAWYGQDVRTSIREQFGLGEKTSRANFYTWPTFLVAGMASTTPAADAIKRYLLDCERAARVGGGMLDIARSQDARLDRAAKVVAMVSKADRIADAALRQQVLIHIDDALDGALHIPRQGDLFPSVE